MKRFGGSYDWKWVRGTKWTCTVCPNTWGYANVSVKQARAEGLDKCPRCGSPGKPRAIRTKL